jgi:digeranylgeranylglycerophospholipid reductase
MSDYDVLIVGAGSVGSRAAQRLAAFGYRVAVLEKNQQIGHKLSCTGIIGRECAELFEVDRSCFLQEAKSAKLFAPCGEYITVNREEPQAYIVDRLAFDRSMARKAQDAGAEYHLSSKVSDIAISDNQVVIEIDQRKTVSGKAVLLASGFGSKLPSKLGLGQIKKVITGVQTEVPTNGIDETEVYFSHKIAPGFFGWLVPVPDSRARVGLFAKEKPGEYLRKLLAQLVLEGKISSAEADFAYGGIPLKPLSRTYSDRVLVIGDAAGQVKPTTGGGIYYGLLCADFAAETIHQAFKKNDFSKKILSQYEKLWKEKLGRELKIDYFARMFYNRLSDKKIDRIFHVVRDNDIHESLLSSTYKSFDWHGELVLDGLKQLGPWSPLFWKVMPAYFLKSLRRNH